MNVQTAHTPERTRPNLRGVSSRMGITPLSPKSDGSKQNEKIATASQKNKQSTVVVNLPTSGGQEPVRRSQRIDQAGLHHQPSTMTVASQSGRQEANTLARVRQLQKEGLWSDKKGLQKTSIAPVRLKTHWDFVIEEMTWMSSVFQQETKVKKLTSRKCAKMVQKHFSDKILEKRRAEKAQEQNLRRIASNMAKEIRTFWGNVEKLFEYSLKTEIEKKRKAALDEHLNRIVDKTEKYSSQLAESMLVNASLRTTPAGSDSEGGIDDVNDKEFIPDQNSDDDEETIAKDDIREEGEIDELKDESEIPVEELLRRYYPELYGNSNKPTAHGDDKTDSDKPDEAKSQTEHISENGDYTDDGKDSRKVENIVKDEDYQVDVKKRKIDEESSDNVDFSENSVQHSCDSSILQDDQDDETETDEEDDEKEDDESDVASVDENAEAESEDTSGTKLLVGDGEQFSEFSDVIEMAAKFQPTGNTLDTTNVKTKIPFLLKHTMREYQHVGLDWLVSMHERKLNGILADEMGLGKTIQTIALLAHLACEKEVWGPHLIVVPTSVMLNWEMELKKWAPAFKIVTYYGNQKERRLKRVGWSKPNSFHICITSYKLVTQDHQSFRRFQWHYLILDEAQHIKNFKSQRWQLLLNFKSNGRLLLTGTPLQNNLMELWSLMHFLMPNVFESHKDFKEWFSNPLTGMVEGSAEYNDNLIKRLHKVLRPFLLRRLKCEVEKQMPKKYQHVVRCSLSKRQRYLYDDFMSRAKTKETLDSGNLLSVINVLMQLRKVCNHPNLFEPRPTCSPFIAEHVPCRMPTVTGSILALRPLHEINLMYHPLSLITHELNLSAFMAHRAGILKVPVTRLSNFLNEEDNNNNQQNLQCPHGKLRLSVKTTVNPAKRTDKMPVVTIIKNGLWKVPSRQEVMIRTSQGTFVLAKKVYPNVNIGTWSSVSSKIQMFPKNGKREINGDLSDSILQGVKAEADLEEEKPLNTLLSPSKKSQEDHKFLHGLGQTEKVANKKAAVVHYTKILNVDEKLKVRLKQTRHLLTRRICENNHIRCQCSPVYGSDLIETLTFQSKMEALHVRSVNEKNKTLEFSMFDLNNLTQNRKDVMDRLQPFVKRYLLFVPSCLSFSPTTQQDRFKLQIEAKPNLKSDSSESFLDRLSTSFKLQLPETRLIQYDCGKLQVMSKLLRNLKTEGHRALIFTQMTKVLDILEAFLSFHGFTYLRLDGSTKVEQRQILMERFNNDSKYFCFILSTRSGGVGINLTGADTVIFYDSDWNPTMDAQAQDRCHRIGQTRDVHIYRLVSDRTVEENILKKANQKRLLGDLAIEGGNFTTAFFKQQTIQDLFNVDDNKRTELGAEEKEIVESDLHTDIGVSKKAIGAFETAITTVEEVQDITVNIIRSNKPYAVSGYYNTLMILNIIQLIYFSYLFPLH